MDPPHVPPQRSTHRCFTYMMKLVLDMTCAPVVDEFTKKKKNIGMIGEFNGLRQRNGKICMHVYMCITF